jgi:predicted ATPase
MLRDLSIKNYRIFKDFSVEGLTRVNLIVGANNSGKTSLLEAIYLLCGQGEPQRLLELIYNRGELVEPEQVVGLKASADFPHRLTGYQVSHTFYGHELTHSLPIHLSSKKDKPLKLDIRLESAEQQSKFFTSGSGSSLEDFPAEIPTNTLNFQYSDSTKYEVPVLGDGVVEPRYFRSGRRPLPNYFINTNAIEFYNLAIIWDNITLTQKEDKVIKALQILEPNVERLSFTSRQTAYSGIMVKLRNSPSPIPLGSLGDGMRRILTLAASTVIAENGLLLVDEIDTGLYYQTLTRMWKLLIETAVDLDVQIFATTHSSDCLRAFQEALESFSDTSIGKLFRLSIRDKKIQAIGYTADELKIAQNQSIEVR